MVVKLVFLDFWLIDKMQHFFVMKGIPHVEVHSSSWFRSCCNIWWSALVFMALQRRQSSAKRQTFDFTLSLSMFYLKRELRLVSISPDANEQRVSLDDYINVIVIEM